MITDNITNAHLYANLTPRIKRAFEYTQQADLLGMALGHYELDGKNLYVIVQEYSSKLKEQGRWEAHRHYIDLQYIVQGIERMGYARLGRLQQGDYNPDKDFLALSGEGDFVTLQSGDFMLLWPEDGHMPGIAVESPVYVKKAVVKISLD
jgi:YhcH/YjgK/YiaL family protein